MTRKEQRRFVTEMMKSLKDSILETSDRWGDDWDGHELRRLIADRCALTVFGDPGKARIRAYKNHCQVYNLP